MVLCWAIYFELICPIYSKHVLIVLLANEGTWYFFDVSIFLLSLNIDFLWGVTVGWEIQFNFFCPSRLLHIVPSFALARNLHGFPFYSLFFLLDFQGYIQIYLKIFIQHFEKYCLHMYNLIWSTNEIALLVFILFVNAQKNVL